MTLPAFSGLLAALLAAASPGAGAEPVVHPPAGAVQGRVEDAVAVFRGLPYAAAPVGRLRWAAPAAPATWTGVRPAAEFGAVCPQPIEPWAHGETGRQNEDCLFLNVWTPAPIRPGARLPVLVWVHGGGYTAGAGSQSTYDGRSLARRGAVIVTINYRLGVLGFLAHPALTREGGGASGDYGLLDQIAALRWVRDNIESFGGDPARVTLAGESAGGGSVLLLTASPQARGLFSRAIVESGAALDVPAGGRTRPTLQEGEAAGAKWAATLSAPGLQAMRALTPAQILATDAPAVSSHPIADGRVVPRDVTLAFRTGQASAVPLLIGWNSAEGAMFAHPKDMADYRAGVRRTTGTAADAVLGLYPPQPDRPLEETAASELGDVTFGWRGWSVASAQAPRAATFVYQFDQAPPRAADTPYRTEGALHSEELGFVWGGAIPDGWPAADRRLSDAVQGYWIGFMRDGAPNAPGLAPWPRFEGAAGPVLWFQDGGVHVGPVPRLDALRRLDAAIAGPGAPAAAR